jgi:glutathione synthase/RimK-type ligase-like ATP-grasp enzyme
VVNVRIYDLAMTHKLDADDLFIHRIQQHCAEARLNFFLIEPAWVENFYQALKDRRVGMKVLLNMHSEHHLPDDIYHKLVKLAAEQQTQVIDPPERALLAFDKSKLHPQLIGAGIHVPYTVIVPRAQIDTIQLTDEQKAGLGSPFVIKPSLGYGRKGLVLDATSEKDLQRSLTAWPDENYLLQKKILPREINGAPAYFRVYFVFGAVWVAWWNCYKDNYRVVTPQEGNEFNLKPLEEIIRRIAALTGMNFFSSEIAQTENGEFVAIDYMNDQCHMLSQSANPQMGVPDEVVAGIARQLVEASRKLVHSRQ